MNKKILSKLLGLIILNFIFAPMAFASKNNVYIQNFIYSDSAYDVVTPVDYIYYIRNARELNWISYMVSQGYTFQGCRVEIIADIDFEYDDFMPIGTYYTPFQGTINGNGHWIKNLKLNFPQYYGIGFVGYLGYYGVVENVNIASSCDFIAYGTLGGVVGWNSGRVYHCSSSARLFAICDIVGGLVGHNDFYGTVENCEVGALSERRSGYGRNVGTFIGENYGKKRKCKTFLIYPW